MSKSTYYFELTKVDFVDKINAELKVEIHKILKNINGGMGCVLYIKSFLIDVLWLLINEYKASCIVWDSQEFDRRNSITLTKGNTVK